MGTHGTKELKLFTSSIGYDYATIRITQSRLDKGLIAIPRGLSALFPPKSGHINLYLDDSSVLLPRAYSSYDSTTRECRIGGMRDWFEKKRVKTGDELVIQVIDKDNFIYRITVEKEFLVNTQELQKKFDSAKQVEEANTILDNLLTWANPRQDVAPLIELLRLTQTTNKSERRAVPISDRRAKETVPAHIRVLHERIYKGHCQLCDFWFLKRDKRPYFEIHHIDAFSGHHPQNLVVVCGNCHNQFEHSDTSLGFDEAGWLRQVRFNDRDYEVYQALVAAKLKAAQKTLYL